MTVVDLFCLMEPSGRSCTTRLTLSAAGGGEESAAGQDQATHEGPEAQSRLSRSRVNECIAAAFLSTFGGRCQGREGKDQARLLNTKHPLQRRFFIGVGYGQNEIKNLELEILCSSILPSRFLFLGIVVVCRILFRAYCWLGWKLDRKTYGSRWGSLIS